MSWHDKILDTLLNAAKPTVETTSRQKQKSEGGSILTKLPKKSASPASGSILSKLPRSGYMAEPREQRMTITVDHTPPTRTPDGRLKFNYWATARIGRQQVEGQAIEFLVNNLPIREDVSRHDGRTTDMEYLSAPGVTEVLLEAQAKGNTAIQARKMPRVEVRTAQAASIRHFKSKDMEHEGNVLIVLRVLDKDGMPVQGIAANLRDKQDPRFIFPVGDPTDRSGMMRFSIPAEPIRDVLVLIQGIEERIRTTYA